MTGPTHTVAGVAVGAFLVVLGATSVLRAVARTWPPRRAHRTSRASPTQRHVVVAIGVGVVAVLVAPALAPLAVASALVAPRARDAWARRREQRAADRELPDVLESVARALRSGASLGQAIAEAPTPTAPSLRTRWGALLAAVPTMGVATAAETAWTVGSAPQRLVGSALRLAADVGGPQARAIDVAAATLRQRLALDDELRAQAAQARASAAVIGLAPVGFAVLAAATDPGYVPFLVRSLPGACLLYAGLALDGAGLLWMARLMRMEARR
jgi:tight adherence protein B